MSANDKRRRARVQGGWAAPAKAGTKPQPKSPPKHSDNTACTSSAPAWMGKTVDCPVKEQKFVYQEPTEEIRMKAEPKVIE